MARKSNSDFRRAGIVRALQTVMAKQGYEKATIQAIAAEAGLAPGLLHYHFKKKQDILVSLVTTLADYGQQRFAELAGAAEDPGARLRAYIEARLGLGPGASQEIVAAWVMIAAEAVRQPEVREAFQRAVVVELDLLTGLLADCLREQGRQEAEARKLAAGVLALMEGAYQLACAAGEVMPTGYAAEAAMRYAVLGIEASALSG
ncbi:TetR/AcrR family transcriptional regulator [Massilia sp. MS-15]|uniref:TetR/AcrR family transcriptional regulator n=1 Tax=Massilia sp. MS-15 TaxID=2878200 RepID=UPI001CD709E3|nr:TetR family transcriptional regulator [Massilia sp. MS-15]MCA1248617.1 TetR family transcriptional regulator [Massilia sp. MS-15]